MKTNFKKRYRDLEMQVLGALRYQIEHSNKKSKTCDTNVIEVNVFDYTELAIINDKLTFITSDGLHASLFSDASLEDLIDILNTLN